MTVPLDRIPDSLGYLVLTEDGAVINVGAQCFILVHFLLKELDMFELEFRFCCISSRREMSFRCIILKNFQGIA